jgi:hypothetical protein
MRLRPATGAACFVISLVLSSRRSEQRDDNCRSDSTPMGKNPKGAPLLPVPAEAHGSENHAPATAAVNQQPNPLKEREVEEAAMPGHQACAHALPSALWQLTLENCQLPPASPQSSFDRLERSHVSLHTLSGRLSRHAIKIPPGCVQKLWTMPVPCGRLRKSLRKLWPQKSSARVFNNLDDVKKIRAAPPALYMMRPT